MPRAVAQDDAKTLAAGVGVGLSLPSRQTKEETRHHRTRSAGTAACVFDIYLCRTVWIDLAFPYREMALPQGHTRQSSPRKQALETNFLTRGHEPLEEPVTRRRILFSRHCQRAPVQSKLADHDRLADRVGSLHILPQLILRIIDLACESAVEILRCQGFGVKVRRKVVDPVGEAERLSPIAIVGIRQDRESGTWIMPRPLSGRSIVVYREKLIGATARRSFRRRRMKPAARGSYQDYVCH